MCFACVSFVPRGKRSKMFCTRLSKNKTKRNETNNCAPPPPRAPSSLPFQDDHPADANYYFSSGEQGRCYLAPERFYSAPQASDGASAAGGGGGAGAGAGAPRAAGGAGAGLAGARGGGLDGLVSDCLVEGRCGFRSGQGVKGSMSCFFHCRRHHPPLFWIFTSRRLFGYARSPFCRNFASCLC